jgi:hypothetical protein
MRQFCPACGAALAKPGLFCPACGVQQTDTEADTKHGLLRSIFRRRPSPRVIRIERVSRVIHESSKPRSSTGMGCLLTLIIGFVVVWAIYNSNDNSRSTSPPTRPDEAVPEKVDTQPPTTVAPETIYVPTRPISLHRKMGEEFSVGYWSYRCYGVEWQSMIVSSFGTPEVPDAQFLIVDLSIRNDDRTSSTLPPIKLVDSQGREYDESSKGTFLRGAFDTLKQVNPGVSSRGYVVFDVPRGDYALKVSGGFESGEHRLIDLSPPADESANQPQKNNEEKPSPSDKPVPPP